MSVTNQVRLIQSVAIDTEDENYDTPVVVFENTLCDVQEITTDGTDTFAHVKCEVAFAGKRLIEDFVCYVLIENLLLNSG